MCSRYNSYDLNLKEQFHLFFQKKETHVSACCLNLICDISQQQVCHMPHLFDSTPFASLAMTSVHARRARNAYITHQDPSAQSTNSAPIQQHPPIIFYDVML